MGARWLVVLAVAWAAPRMVFAQTFAEGWEAGTVKWHALDNQPIVVATDPDVCSSKYQRETIRYSGGRVFNTLGIPIEGGQPYCLAAWVRGSALAQPFLGLRKSDANGGFSDAHWLIGFKGYPNGYGGMVVPVTSDGQWRWYTAPFTMDNGWSFVVVMSELFVSGAPGSADFDDIALWAGPCPNAPTGSLHAKCALPKPACGDDGLCQQCGVNDASACAGITPVCDGKKCIGCTKDDQCGGATPACRPDGSCGQCGQGNVAQCGGLTPACDLAKGTCRACQNDGECGGNTPACQKDGSCGQCAQSNAKLCLGATPVCNAATGTCALCTVSGGDGGGDSTACAMSADGHACQSDQQGALFCGCALDGDCGDKQSGRVCDAMQHKCIDGCSPAQDRNGCPKALFCTSDDLTGAVTGVCTKSCNFDADCAVSPDKPFCLMTGHGGLCVGCRADGECQNHPKGPICALPSYTCVQCTAKKKGACLADTVGAGCLNGRCGCLLDNDCGAKMSGRICNNGTGACAEGCRGFLGNGCPQGLLCTSKSLLPGTCEPPPPDLAMARDLAHPVDGGAPGDLAATAPDLDQGLMLVAPGCACAIGTRHRLPPACLALLLLALVIAPCRRARRRR
ncbi:MAG: hypothetical protein EXR72_18870 [Myxococcales bacterium]|nr:hypothetical protein [Myxococcales bacterium]